MNKLFSVDNLVKLLPPYLLKDKEYKALATVIARELYALHKETPKLIIFANLDELPEAVLDILAEDLNISWYDKNYNLEAKRATIRDSRKVHKTLGTKYAVETALGNVFKGSRVEECFEYGGKPYTFRIAIGITEAGLKEENQNAVLEKVKFYKNVRSKLESINYKIEQKAEVLVNSRNKIAVMLEIYPRTATSIKTQGDLCFAGIAKYKNIITISPLGKGGNE